jgi:hypothetical protein
MKVVRRNIHPASVLINKLAKPRCHALLETFKAHRHHFHIFQVEALIKKICEYQFQTYQQVMNEIKQKLREKEYHVMMKQKMEIKKMRKKIENCYEFDSLAETLEKSFRHVIMIENDGDQCSVQGSEENKKLSQFVHTSLSNVIKCPHDNKNTESVLLEFSEKFAWCMRDVFKRYAKEHESVCMDRFKKNCVPIDGYYPFELSQESFIFNESDEESENNEYSESVQEDLIEKINNELSFLRLSQIHITLEECQLVAEKLRRIEVAISKGTMKRSASKKNLNDVKSLQDAGLGGLNIKKKKKPKKKKKKGKKINLKCLGNLNPKPQWAVEWNARSEAIGNNTENEN